MNPNYQRERSCTKPSECRSCKAPILWAESFRTGKKMPIDASPTMDGNLILAYRKSENRLFLESFGGEGVHHGRLRYTSHFQTCPDRKEHRR